MGDMNDIIPAAYLLSVKQAAYLLGVKPLPVYQLCGVGQVAAHSRRRAGRHTGRCGQRVRADRCGPFNAGAQGDCPGPTDRLPLLGRLEEGQEPSGQSNEGLK